MSALRADEFEFISGLLKKHLGLALTPDKEYLLESRLVPIARAREMDGLSALIQKLRTAPAPDLLGDVVEAMTTNESLFFRDGKPFEQLKAILLPKLRELADSRKTVRIWSAACSTGQEPFSVAMTILEEPNAPVGWKYEIIATDIAQKVLDKAASGVYTQFEAQRGLPIQMLMKYFQPQPDTTWKIKDNLKSMVQFRKVNLLESINTMGKFDIIMCRNVLIYFDDNTKADIVRRMADILNPGGILMIGSTEAVVDPDGKYIQFQDLRGVYQKK